MFLEKKNRLLGSIFQEFRQRIVPVRTSNGVTINILLFNNCVNNATKRMRKWRGEETRCLGNAALHRVATIFIPPWIKGYFVALLPLLYARQTEESFTWIDLQQP